MFVLIGGVNVTFSGYYRCFEAIIFNEPTFTSLRGLASCCVTSYMQKVNSPENFVLAVCDVVQYLVKISEAAVIRLVICAVALRTFKGK